MKPTMLCVASALWLGACENAAPRSSQRPVAATATDRHTPAPGPVAERHFGAAPRIAGEPVAVADVLGAPERYLNQDIKCAGQVARVCEAAGCWLELRAADAGQALRVPMAGHSFFVPRDVVGKQVIVEGRLGARELSEPELAHLKGEGLKAIGPLYLEASSVVVR